MIVDLHAHYPMQLEAATSRMDPPRPNETLGDVIRRVALGAANRAANFHNGKPVVTIENLQRGNVQVALSVLYLPFDEMDFSKPYGAPPGADYFSDLVGLMNAVEASVTNRRKQDAVFARSFAEVQAGIAAGKTVLIHAVEGGFHIGDSEAAIRANVRTLRQRGVAYITVAHLFFRDVATNAPALPFLDDKSYDELFPQPAAGLRPLGRAMIEAMVEQRILIDITHMSERAIDDTLALLDQIDPQRQTPIIATHGACRHADADYNLSERHLQKIAERNGVVGVIACRHWMEEGLFRPKNFAQSREIFETHIQRIRDVTGSDDVAAIGSDLDGFIKPPLPGFETPAVFSVIEQRMKVRFGDAVGAKISSGNAMRVLQHWG